MLVDVMSSYCEQYFESTRIWLCLYSSLSERQNINIESAKKKISSEDDDDDEEEYAEKWNHKNYLAHAGVVFET